MYSTAHILVIGGGIAGQAVCEATRQLHPDVPITLVCAEEHPPYDRVRLGALLTPGATVDELRLRPDAWYDDHAIALRLGTRVTALDPDAQCATLDDGTVLHFEHAVLCTGSDAFVPSIPGRELTGVEVFRDPQDCAAMLRAAQTASHAAVIGGGLLGLEAAYALAGQGCATSVIHLVDRLMERQLDAAAAALLAPSIAGLGVDVRLEHATAEIVAGPGGRVSALRFADNTMLDCDLVVVAVGIAPQVGLARATGLDVERGVVVDDRMVSSHPRVLAVGECAQHRGVVHGIVAPIHDQAKVAAQTLTGGEALYMGSIPTAKLKVMGIDLVTAGQAEGPAEIVVADQEARTYRKLICDADGTVIGAVLLGDARGAELLSDAVRTRRVTDDPRGLLAEASQATAAELPDSAQVCNCNGVCKGAIVGAIRAGGLGSTQEVVSVTRAGAGCGSCKPVVSELLAIERAGAAEEPAYLCPCRRQTREDLAQIVREEGIESVSELSESCGAGRDCGACKPGLAYLVSEIQNGRFREERHARFINDRVHANIQNDGTFSVIPRIRGGVVTADQLRRIADAADKYELPMIKITGGQRIDLLGARKEQLPAIWEDLGMPSGYAYAKAVRTVKTCVGSEFCRFGLGDAITTGIDLERAMEGLHTPHKVKAAVSGCPRNCAESYVKDIGVVAVEGGWEIYVGGAAGASVRKGDLL
ncbi:MAG: nitrite reductase large subunit NirB, partial [Baekduia sp.]